MRVEVLNRDKKLLFVYITKQPPVVGTVIQCESEDAFDKELQVCKVIHKVENKSQVVLRSNKHVTQTYLEATYQVMVD